MTCVHCGLPACRVFLIDGKWQASAPPNSVPDAKVITWSDAFEDSEESTEELLDRKAWMCLECGIFSEESEKMQSCSSHSVVRLTVLSADHEGNLQTCPRCGGQSGAFPSILRDFRSREDAPTAVLAETVIRNLPFDENDASLAELPAHGRNLLVFSDARQRAAFFAPYLEQTTLEAAFASPIVSTIAEEEAREGRPPTFEEVAKAYVRGMETRRLAVLRKRDEAGAERFDVIPRRRLRAEQKSAAHREAQILLFQNFCSSYRSKTTLPGTGLAALEFDFTEEERDSFRRTVPEIFAGGEARGWQALHALLEVFLIRKAIEFPPGISSKDILNPGPTAVTFHLETSGVKDGRQVVRWNPYLAHPRHLKRAISASRPLNVIARLLGLDKHSDEKPLSSLLTKIWDVLKESLLLETANWPGEHRLDPSLVQVTTRANWGLCGRCGRLTTLIDLGFCLAGDCPGKIRRLSADDCASLFARNHYRQRYRERPLEIRVKEHTAQLTNEVGKEYQRRFMSGEINVLSSSTTFEMGVDVGALKAVLLRNVPPTTSSYIQRAGRAGRRKDGVSVALTFCRNVPHDQYHYQTPEHIILGKVPSPYLNLDNVPLTQRHCNSLLLGYFLRSASGGASETFDALTIESFFLQPSGAATLADRFVSWLGDPQNRRQMISSLETILAPGSAVTAGAAIDRSGATLLSGDECVFTRDVVQPLQRLQEQLDQIEGQMQTATGPVRISLAKSSNSLERLIRQFREERLIDFLSSSSWLPGYAFPQDIVKLLVRQVEYGQRMRLQRDREVGISEYAPDSEIVADGVLFTSAGVWFNSREPEVRQFARCPQCRKIDTYLETERPSRVCSRCGTRLTGRFLPRHYIRPDGFTTMVSEPVRLPGRSRRAGSRTSEVFLLEGAAAEDFQLHSVGGVKFAEKKGGRLFLANSGHQFQGYFICRKCGRGYSDPPANATHDTPWGAKCSGSCMRLDLAHEFTTDILQLRFQACTPQAPPITDRSFWLSFVSAFLNGASDALNIDARDLGGTYHGWTEESYVGELVVYDRIPGGAGHINRIIGKLPDVLGAALKRVRDCRCPDIEASCYACLRSYGNQFYWEELRRKPVIDWLSGILASV